MKYFLLIFFAMHEHPLQSEKVGPFDNLLACEKAASMAHVAALEAAGPGLWHRPALTRFGSVCLGTKDLSFRLAAPKR